jgi:hypothetical protein
MKLSPHARNEIITTILVAVIFALIIWAAKAMNG